MKIVKKEEFDDAHPWRSNSDRFPLDQVLRRLGFRLSAKARRVADCEPLWERNGQIFFQSEAQRQAIRETNKVEDRDALCQGK